MSYFTIKSSFWLVPSNRCEKEFQKIDKFMEFLEKSGVGKIIESVKSKDKQCKGRKGYNPYNLLAYQYFIQLLEYEEKEKNCGKNRNSYYKTDKDATAMLLKKDYYSKLSHDFHAGYNVQVLVSNLLILMYGVFQDRTDYYTFIPMNNLYFKYYQRYPRNICADSGYGIYINYKYLREYHIGNYVKFQTWSGETSGKSPQLFYAFDDGVMCLDICIGKKIPFNQVNHQRNKDGKLFKFMGRNHCKYAYKCRAKLKHKDYDYRIVKVCRLPYTKVHGLVPLYWKYILRVNSL